MGENGGKLGKIGRKGTDCTTQLPLFSPISPHFPPSPPHFPPFPPIFPRHEYIVGMFVGTAPATGAGYF